MTRRPYAFLGGLLALLTAAGPARGGILGGAFTDRSFGARAMGLGGAYTAVADDPYAVGLSPGGLGFQELPSAALDYANLYNLDLLTQTYFAGVLPIGRNVWGMAFRNLSVSFDPFPQRLSESTFTVAYGRAFDRLGVGVAGKYFRVGSDFVQGSAVGAGFDLGLSYRLSPRVAVGLAASDLGSTIKWATGWRESVPREFRFGLAWRPTEKWLVSGDFVAGEGEIAQEIRVGTEYWFLRSVGRHEPGLFRSDERDLFAFALRAGLSAELFEDGAVTPTVGLTAGFEGLHFDYAYLVDSKNLGATNRFSLVYTFGKPIVRREGREEPRPAPLPTAARPLPPKTVPSAAVSPFEDLSGDPSLAWLSEGLAAIVRKALLRRGIAVREDGAFRVAGRYFQSEGRIFATVRLSDRNGKVLDVYSYEAAPEDIFPLGETLGEEAARRIAAISGR